MTQILRQTSGHPFGRTDSHPLGHAHVGPHPSVHDTVAGILNRFNHPPTEEVVSMNLAKAKSLLTKEERHILAHEHISFHVNVPVKVFVIRDAAWATSRSGQGTRLQAAWSEVHNSKQTSILGEGFSTGPNWPRQTLSGNDHHYGAPSCRSSRPKLEITKMYPGQLRTAR